MLPASPKLFHSNKADIPLLGNLHRLGSLILYDIKRNMTVLTSDNRVLSARPPENEPSLQMANSPARGYVLIAATALSSAKARFDIFLTLNYAVDKPRYDQCLASLRADIDIMSHISSATSHTLSGKDKFFPRLPDNASPRYSFRNSIPPAESMPNPFAD